MGKSPTRFLGGGGWENEKRESFIYVSAVAN